MSTLRKCLTRPGPYLLAICAALLLVALDSLRAPAEQVTAGVYLRAVRGYQSHGRPLLRGYIHCRYRPTCSEYSVDAVRKYGIGRGLVLTATRIASCTAAVEEGTADPVR